MFKKFFKAGIGGAGSQAINFFALPVISRLYMPKDYAIWAIIIASSSILGSIACLRYELAIVLPKDDEEASSLLWSCLILSSIFAIIAILLIAEPNIQKIITGKNEAIDYRYAWILPLLVFLTGLNAALQYWGVRKQLFLLSSIAMIGLTGATVSVQIALAMLFSSSSIGLLIGTFIGYLIYSIIMISGILITRQQPLFAFKVFYNIPTVIKKYKLFLYYSTPFTIFGILRSRASVYILDAFLNAKMVGLYAFCFRILNFPVMLVSGALRPVLFQQTASKGVNALESRLNMILKNLAIFSLPFFVFYLYYPEDTFDLVFGNKWREAGEIGLYLVWPAYTFLFCNWMDRILDVLRKQKLALILEVIFSILSLSGFTIAFLLGFNIKGALFIQCSILVTYNIVYIYATYKCAKYRINPLVNLMLIMIILGILEWLFLKTANLLFGSSAAIIIYILGNIIFYSLTIKNYKGCI